MYCCVHARKCFITWSLTLGSLFRQAVTTSRVCVTLCRWPFWAAAVDARVGRVCSNVHLPSIYVHSQVSLYVMRCICRPLWLSLPRHLTRPLWPRAAILLFPDYLFNDCCHKPLLSLCDPRPLTLSFSVPFTFQESSDQVTQIVCWYFPSYCRESHTYSQGPLSIQCLPSMLLSTLGYLYNGQR